ncbi:MAG: tetratricopeptide repeat protein [Planctomycetota bacterium]|jgi:tetratricopeptide (TPR) repeat protein
MAGKSSTPAGPTPIQTRSKILGLLGDLFIRRGEVDLALGLLREKLVLCEEMVNWDAFVETQLMLGHAYRMQSSFGQASDHYRKALAVSRQHGLKMRIGEALNNIATTYFFQKEIEKALEYFQASLVELRDNGVSSLLGRTLMHIGNIHRKEEENKKAERFYTEAEKVLKEVGDEYNLGMTLANHALLSFSQDDEDSGRTYIREAFERLFFSHADSEIQLFKATLETVYGIRDLN